MAYIIGVRRYHREQQGKWDVAVPDDATHWLVVDEDGDEDTLKRDTTLGVFGNPEDATRFLKEWEAANATR